MRIKKTSETTPKLSQSVNSYSDSTSDSYSCNYINDNFNLNEVELETVLYDNIEGSNNNIELNDSVANYDCVEVFYRTNDNFYSSTRVHEPQNKIANFMGVYGITGTSGIYMKSKSMKLYNNTITIYDNQYQEMSIVNSGNSALGSNVIYITKVIGYKNTIPSVVQKESEVYSTEEQVIGTWIDGKPLYKATIYISSLPNRTATNYNHNIANIDEVYGIEGVLKGVYEGNYYFEPIVNMNAGNISATACGISISRNAITIYSQNADRSGNSAYITIRYTKTTD